MGKPLTEDDVVGKRFGMLVVKEMAYRTGKKKRLYLKCVCDCGNEKIALYDSLKAGKTRSCGCLVSKEERSKRSSTHGLSKSKLYKIWDGIKYRCYGKNCLEYDRYGGRGIGMCDAWKNDFMSFYDWSMNNGFEDGLSIDRIDNNGNYEPTNCRWANDYEQGANKRNNIVIEYNGETHILSEWARITGIKRLTLRKRYFSGLRGDELFDKRNRTTGLCLSERSQ